VKRIFLFFGIFSLLQLLTFPAVSQYKVKCVVIDAGHGGKDPGALGAHSKEKDIALAIALKTGEYIQKYLPDVKVVFTRTNDTFIELYKRASIANDCKADLFISIHCNAARTAVISGTETYVMGLHKSEANLEVAKLENAAILKEENYADMYEGFNPNLDEDYITLTMFQNAFLEQSTVLANEVEKEFRERVKRKDRGVFQAGFLVLYKTAMPGVLIETSFISNPDDEKFLMSNEGQVYLSSAIFRAFKTYKDEMERGDNKAKPVAQDNLKAKKETKPKPVIYFRVQFASYKNPKEITSRKFKDLEDIRKYKQDGLFKYTTGNFTSYDEALKLLDNLHNQKKYKDAFIVSFQGEDRISLDDALQLLKN
jgi:N-acetylmuramoyl-L-alanine amidase